MRPALPGNGLGSFSESPPHVRGRLGVHRPKVRPASHRSAEGTECRVEDLGARAITPDVQSHPIDSQIKRVV